MSIVGPRPTLEYQVERYDERQLQRLSVRPGLTGLAQVRGRNELLWAQRIELDLEYVACNSLRVDLGLLIATVPTILAGGGVEGHPSDDPLARPDPPDADESHEDPPGDHRHRSAGAQCSPPTSRGLERRGQDVETVALAPGDSPVRLDLEVLDRVEAGAVHPHRAPPTILERPMSSSPTARRPYRRVRSRGRHRPHPGCPTDQPNSLYWAPTRLRRARCGPAWPEQSGWSPFLSEARQVLCDSFGVAPARIVASPTGVPRGEHRAATAPAEAVGAAALRLGGGRGRRWPC